MKKFVRIEAGEKLAGVCTGLSEYFDVDVTIVRLGFVFGTFLWGGAVLLYLVLALVAPKRYDW